MNGAGYVLSWDLVTWLSEHRDELQPFMRTMEDKAISEMLKWGGKAEQSFISITDEYMDHPSLQRTDWTRELGPDVILVHGLKTPQLLGDVIQYFLGNSSANIYVVSLGR